MICSKCRQWECSPSRNSFCIDDAEHDDHLSECPLIEGYDECRCDDTSPEWTT